MNKIVISIFLLIGLLILNNNCTTSQLAKRDITRVIQSKNISFEPPFENEIFKDIDITVTPIDSKILDKETFFNSLNDGNYSRKFSIDYYIRNFEKSDYFSNVDEDEWNLKKEIIQYLKELVQNNEIEIRLAIELTNKIIDSNNGISGLEIDSRKLYPDNYNPYKIDENYFSVFKVEFKNLSSSIQKIQIDNILVNSGYEQLYPLNNSYFEKRLKNKQEKFENLLRLNMPDELILTPKQSVIKYISVPSLNYIESELKLSIINDDQIVEFIYTPKILKNEETINFESYFFTPDKYYSIMIHNSYVLKRDELIMPLKSSEYYIDKEKSDSKYSIYGISSLEGGYAFGKLENFTFNKYPKREIEIPFKKMKKYK